MAIVLGMNCKLYYGDAGSQADTLASNVKDVNLNLETGVADVTTRGANGWRLTAATLKDGSVEFEMMWDTGDAFFTAIQEAWTDSSNIALLVLTGAVGAADSEGLDADFSITNFSRNEPLEEAVTVSVTAKPAYSTRAPSWYSVS